MLRPLIRTAFPLNFFLAQIFHSKFALLDSHFLPTQLTAMVPQDCSTVSSIAVPETSSFHQSIIPFATKTPSHFLCLLLPTLKCCSMASPCESPVSTQYP